MFYVLGPPKLLWFGSYIFMLMLNSKHLHLAIDKLCHFYQSNVIGFHLSCCPVIVVNDLRSVKDALYHRDFDGRPDILLTRLRHPDFKPFHGWCESKIRFDSWFSSKTILKLIFYRVYQQKNRYFLPRREVLAWTKAFCIAVFARFWFWASFWLIGKRNWSTNQTIHWHCSKWTEVRTWKGSW